MVWFRKDHSSWIDLVKLSAAAFGAVLLNSFPFCGNLPEDCLEVRGDTATNRSATDPLEFEHDLEGVDGTHKTKNLGGVGSKQLAHVCQHCQKKFTQKSNLTTHLIIHTEKRPFVCRVCGKSCAQLAALKKHLKTHEAKKPSVCELCEKSYEKKGNLEKHMQTFHGITPGSSQHGYSERKASSNAQHDMQTEKLKSKFLDDIQKVSIALKEDEQREAHVCQHCQKKFLKKWNLTVHLRTHMRFLCNVCERRFAELAHLKNHLRKHKEFQGATPGSSQQDEDRCFDRGASSNAQHDMQTEESKSSFFDSAHSSSVVPKEDKVAHNMQRKPHVCWVCPKRFSSDSNLTNHMRTHTKEKPFFCSTCQRAFSQHGNLLTHMKRHEAKGEKEAFLCGVCDAPYKYKGNLENHMTQYHGVALEASMDDAVKSASQNLLPSVANKSSPHMLSQSASAEHGDQHRAAPVEEAVKIEIGEMKLIATKNGQNSYMTLKQEKEVLESDYDGTLLNSNMPEAESPSQVAQACGAKEAPSDTLHLGAHETQAAPVGGNVKIEIDEVKLLSDENGRAVFLSSEEEERIQKTTVKLEHELPGSSTFEETERQSNSYEDEQKFLALDLKQEEREIKVEPFYD